VRFRRTTFSISIVVRNMPIDASGYHAPFPWEVV